MPKPPVSRRKSHDILQALLDPSRSETVPWSSSDLRAMLEHQLATALIAELDQLAARAQYTREHALSILAGCCGASFGDLLRATAPSGRALKMVKDYAKGALGTEGDLPRDVARVLYVLAILRGRQVGIEDMTALDEASLARETRRCLTFGWLPEDIRALLRRGVLDR